MPGDTLPRLLSTKDLSEYLQIPVRTLEKWRAAEYGPHFIYVGKRVRYREPDVAAWIDSQ